jgi:hypothetical protein
MLLTCRVCYVHQCLACEECHVAGDHHDVERCQARQCLVCKDGVRMVLEEVIAFFLIHIEARVADLATEQTLDQRLCVDSRPDWY